MKAYIVHCSSGTDQTSSTIRLAESFKHFELIKAISKYCLDTQKKEIDFNSIEVYWIRWGQDQNIQTVMSIPKDQK